MKTESFAGFGLVVFAAITWFVTLLAIAVTISHPHEDQSLLLITVASVCHGLLEWGKSR